MIQFDTIESAFTPTTDQKASMANDGMIATQCPQATQTGKDILRQGGNAVDAAVAAALALGVCEPQASGLGGQTMLLMGDEQRKIAIDGSSRAPSLAHASSIYKSDRALGYRASTVPSTLAALHYTHKIYGKLKWSHIVDPVIALAADGYPISALQSKLLQREQHHFEAVSAQSGLRYFYHNGKPYQEGQRFVQPDLARLLTTIRDTGIKEFYRGKIAKQIDADMRENGGLLRYDDLAFIPQPIEREPIVGKFRGLDIYTMPPPGAGVTFLYALKMLDFLPRDYRIESDNTLYHIIISILRKAFLERADRPFDPNFFQQIAETAKMLDDDFALASITEVIKDVDENLLPIVPTEDESHGDTTHLSVIDKDGLAVSLTQSIERVYGSKAAADGLGFLYNNYLYDFEYNMPEHPYYIRPNANPWATVAPSLVYNDDNIWMAIGSPGSERIVPALLLFLLRIIDRNTPIDQSMTAPRIHCSLGGKVSLEAGRFDAELIPYLLKKGYRIDQREDYAFFLGCIQAVLKCQSRPGFQAIADVRRDGTAQ